MPWQEPKLDWESSDAPIKDDFNRIEGNVQELEDTKVDKIVGKGLSTNDYTDTEQTKLAGIETGATKDQTAAEILTALKTVDTNTSGLNANYLQGKTASDIGGIGDKHYGSVTYADIAVARGETITKYIPLGGYYKHGTIVFYNSSLNAGTVAFISTDKLKSFSINTVEIRHRSNSSELIHRIQWAGIDEDGKMSVLDAYISGTNIVIVFKDSNNNLDAILDTIIRWEVYK